MADKTINPSLRPKILAKFIEEKAGVRSEHEHRISFNREPKFSCSAKGALENARSNDFIRSLDAVEIQNLFGQQPIVAFRTLQWFLGPSVLVLGRMSVRSADSSSKKYIYKGGQVLVMKATIQAEGEKKFLRFCNIDDEFFKNTEVQRVINEALRGDLDSQSSPSPAPESGGFSSSSKAEVVQACLWEFKPNATTAEVPAAPKTTTGDEAPATAEGGEKAPVTLYPLDFVDIQPMKAEMTSRGPFHCDIKGAMDSKSLRDFFNFGSQSFCKILGVDSTKALRSFVLQVRNLSSPEYFLFVIKESSKSAVKNLCEIVINNRQEKMDSIPECFSSGDSTYQALVLKCNIQATGRSPAGDYLLAIENMDPKPDIKKNFSDLFSVSAARAPKPRSSGPTIPYPSRVLPSTAPADDSCVDFSSPMPSVGAPAFSSMPVGASSPSPSSTSFSRARKGLSSLSPLNTKPSVSVGFSGMRSPISPSPSWPFPPGTTTSSREYVKNKTDLSNMCMEFWTKGKCPCAQEGEMDPFALCSKNHVMFGNEWSKKTRFGKLCKDYPNCKNRTCLLSHVYQDEILNPPADNDFSTFECLCPEFTILSNCPREPFCPYAHWRNSGKHQPPGTPTQTSPLPSSLGFEFGRTQQQPDTPYENPSFTISSQFQSQSQSQQQDLGDSTVLPILSEPTSSQTSPEPASALSPPVAPAVSSSQPPSFKPTAPEFTPEDSSPYTACQTALQAAIQILKHAKSPLPVAGAPSIAERAMHHRVLEGLESYSPNIFAVAIEESIEKQGSESPFVKYGDYYSLRTGYEVQPPSAQPPATRMHLPGEKFKIPVEYPSDFVKNRHCFIVTGKGTLSNAASVMSGFIKANYGVEVPRENILVQVQKEGEKEPVTLLTNEELQSLAKSLSQSSPLPSQSPEPVSEASPAPSTAVVAAKQSVATPTYLIAMCGTPGVFAPERPLAGSADRVSTVVVYLWEFVRMAEELEKLVCGNLPVAEWGRDHAKVLIRDYLAETFNKARDEKGCLHEMRDRVVFNTNVVATLGGSGSHQLPTEMCAVLQYQSDTKSLRFVNYMLPAPEISGPAYYSTPSQIAFDSHLPLFIGTADSIAHEFVSSHPNLAAVVSPVDLTQAMQTALRGLSIAVKKDARMPVPAYVDRRIQFLLPVAVRAKDLDLVLAFEGADASKGSGHYFATKLLTRQEAALRARLLGPIHSNWLRVDA